MIKGGYDVTDNLTRKIRGLPFEWSPAAKATVEVISELHKDGGPVELQQYWVSPVGDLIELERESESNALSTVGTNFEFLCGREYPDEGKRLDNPDVSLQVLFQPESGYQARVFLRGEGLPPVPVRRELVFLGALTHHSPRRTDEYFLREKLTITSLETDDYEQRERFKQAVVEALELFVLRSWRQRN